MGVHPFASDFITAGVSNLTYCRYYNHWIGVGHPFYCQRLLFSPRPYFTSLHLILMFLFLCYCPFSVKALVVGGSWGLSEDIFSCMTYETSFLYLLQTLIHPHMQKSTMILLLHLYCLALNAAVLQQQHLLILSPSLNFMFIKFLFVATLSSHNCYSFSIHSKSLLEENHLLSFVIL